MEIRLLILLSLSFLFITSCGDDKFQDSEMQSKEELKKEEQNKVAELSKIVFGDDNRLNIKTQKPKAQELLDTYTNYYNRYPKDKNTAEYLFKGGEIARGLGKNRQAIEMYKNAHDLYPSFDKRIESLFLVGFIYNNNLKSKDQAAYYYNFIIENYPDHHFAEQAKGSLKVLYMTDAELIESFKKMNQ